MAERGAHMLRALYGAPSHKVRVVPHGAPSRGLHPTDAFKKKLGLGGRQILLTFGLLSPNKGIETIIQALPRIVRASPNAMYVVAGATHPHLLQREGERYRDSLTALADDLGVAEHLSFINRYLGDEELLDVLAAADVYVTPYLTEAQITSGTLSYALALGRPTVSTPYWHAQEALADGVGILCPFGDATAFGDAISELLTDDRRRAGLSRAAYMAARPSRWEQVGSAYIAAALGGDRITSADENDDAIARYRA
jgi:glycosyltransferase involved in cell wall biosynthesis